MKISKEEFEKLADKYLVALKSYTYDREGNKPIKIYGIDELYKAINVIQCCETLEMEHAATSEEYAEAIIDMNKNPQDSNNAFKKVVLENAIDKFKQDLSKL